MYKVQLGAGTQQVPPSTCNTRAPRPEVRSLSAESHEPILGGSRCTSRGQHWECWRAGRAPHPQSSPDHGSNPTQPRWLPLPVKTKHKRTSPKLCFIAHDTIEQGHGREGAPDSFSPPIKQAGWPRIQPLQGWRCHQHWHSGCLKASPHSQVLLRLHIEGRSLLWIRALLHWAQTHNFLLMSTDHITAQGEQGPVRTRQLQAHSSFFSWAQPLRSFKRLCFKNSAVIFRVLQTLLEINDVRNREYFIYSSSETLKTDPTLPAQAPHPSGELGAWPSVCPHSYSPTKLGDRRSVHTSYDMIGYASRKGTKTAWFSHVG